jgi:transcriptional regulator of arginine metabolism
MSIGSLPPLSKCDKIRVMPMTKAKKKRMEAIGDLIAEKKSITAQSELVELLAAMGIKATQSSISRDLQDLGVKRVKGRYVLKPWREVGAADFEGVLGFVQGIRMMGPHLSVMATSPNTAKLVAEALTATEWPELGGVLAGDDTIFIATDSKEHQIELFNRLRQYLKR